MMKWVCFGACVLSMGCSEMGAPKEEAEILEEYPEVEAEMPTGEGTKVEVSQVVQRSQFADDAIFNIVDVAPAPSMYVTADFNPVTVNVYYVSAKTTDSGSTPGTAALVQTVELGADETKLLGINLAHAAFAGGYGSLVVSASGNGAFDVFQVTLTSTQLQQQSAGGSVFAGGSYRIPALGSSTKMVLAITNQSDFAFDVELSLIGTSHFKVINIPPLSTYKFDSQAKGWVFPSTPRSVQVFTTNGGTIYLSGYLQRGTSKYRIAPVKAAPYF